MVQRLIEAYMNMSPAPGRNGTSWFPVLCPSLFDPTRLKRRVLVDRFDHPSCGLSRRDSVWRVLGSSASHDPPRFPCPPLLLQRETAVFGLSGNFPCVSRFLSGSLLFCGVQEDEGFWSGSPKATSGLSWSSDKPFRGHSMSEAVKKKKSCTEDVSEFTPPPLIFLFLWNIFYLFFGL